MWSKSISLVIPLVMILQIHGADSCTFVDQEDDFVADVVYEMLKETKDLCLVTCYEEGDCTFVKYFEGVCTIFGNGETHQAGGDNVYKLDCQLTLTTCRRLPLASELKFQKLQEPKSKQSKTRIRELLAKNIVSLTTLYMFKKNGAFFFSKSESAFTDGTVPRRGLVFAKNPQPECVSVPVFLKAKAGLQFGYSGQHKLYFGSVYNVTGYEFLDAYAFTTYCACDGICCGQVPLTKNTIGDANDYVQGLQPDISDVEQVLYIANVLRGEDNIPWQSANSTVCLDLY
ncbi:unnamed protein product [Cylicocyclus nassatus]|uniref:Apple domain-containing protein n=1 Tax=Cylicocyclus nassatus TaxID=53992 RepID=A0AA36GNV2_CYLNA|nr:unnamed protein product [Cylicocyclus nassatus]